MQGLKHIESTFSHYISEIIVALLLFSHSGKSIYDPLLLKLILLRS